MYEVTSMPLISRTRATLRSAEFGFFGVVVYTRVHTPRRWGAPFRAGDFVFVVFDSRPLRTNCWIVGTQFEPRGESALLGIDRRTSSPAGAMPHGPTGHPTARAGHRQLVFDRRAAAAVPGRGAPVERGPARM